jgi:glucan-binding YG repeat protein
MLCDVSGESMFLDDDDGVMLSDISGKWLLLDADGIMLSDISGKWLLLDADGICQTT